jgi:hypothetical protein
MCLACTIPVRGRTLGSECLATALGTEEEVPEVLPREPGAAAGTVARAGLAVAVAASILPWSRFGPGAGPFGAWSARPDWSMVAAVAAAAGLTAALLGTALGVRPRWRDAIGLVAGLVVAAASILAAARPPAFASPWLGPWIALLGGLIAGGGSVAALRAATERVPAMFDSA